MSAPTAFYPLPTVPPLPAHPGRADFYGVNDPREHRQRAP